MILLQHEIQGATTPITICPLGDIQWAGEASEVALTDLQAHIARCLTLPNPWFLGMGDYTDFASPSNREALRTAKLYDTARKVVDKRARELTDECFRRILKPTKGRWLGLLAGHHYFELRDGTTTDQYLARLLDAPFLGVCAIVQVVFRDRTHKQTIKLYAHHGCGSSVFPHGPLNKLYRIAPAWNVDVFLMGHQTKKAVGEFDFIDPVFTSEVPHLVHSTRHLVGTGGWSKGYRAGDEEGTYIERGMMTPVALGAPIIHVRPWWGSGERREWNPRITVEA